MFVLNLNLAVELIETLKTSDPELRFRIETCVKKAEVRLYMIKHNKIIRAYRIVEGVPIVTVDKE